MDLGASFSEIKALADDLYAKQDYLGAAEEYRKLAAQHPNNAVVLKQLGLALTMGKFVDDGIGHLKQAALLQPTDPEIRYSHGYALGNAGRFDEAIEELDAALNLQPNHIAARQGVIYCLLTSGQEIFQVNPVPGEQRLARASKLDAQNPHVAAAYLEALVKTKQVGKAVAYIKDIDDVVRKQSPLRELLDSLESDKDFALHLKHSAVATKPDPLPYTQSRTIQQVSCPACKKPVMSYVTTCPHCGLHIRQSVGFTTRRSTSSGEWQDLAFTLTAIAWLVLAGLEFWVAYPMSQKAKMGNMYSVQIVACIFQAFFGLGLLFRQEWLSYLAKVYGYVSVGAALIFATMFISAGKSLPAALYGVHIVVTCFLMYLATQVVGD
jgi:tetratricopeptide (TPR) repeat protein